eukprot:gene8463-biopygen15165
MRYSRKCHGVTSAHLMYQIVHQLTPAGCGLRAAGCGLRAAGCGLAATAPRRALFGRNGSGRLLFFLGLAACALTDYYFLDAVSSVTPTPIGPARRARYHSSADAGLHALHKLRAGLDHLGLHLYILPSPPGSLQSARSPAEEQRGVGVRERGPAVLERRAHLQRGPFRNERSYVIS